MRIFLIRHGESTTNTGENYTLGYPDHKVTLTKKGEEQALKAGQFLSEYIKANEIDVSRSRMWISPYERTRTTARILNEHIEVPEVREHLNLVEMQFGLFDALPYEEWGTKFPDEFAHYQKCLDFNGKFWARMPLGESPYDVALRVHSFFGTLSRDAEKSGIENVFVVSHGTMIRTFVMQWMHYAPEWFENERNPFNCSIRLLDGHEDKGYLNSKEN